MPDPAKKAAPYRLTYETGARSKVAPPTPAPDVVEISDEPSTPTRAHKAITLSIVVVALVAILASLLMGNAMTAIAVAIVCLTMLQGLWRGAAEVFGVVVAMIIAVLLAPSLGRLFEGMTQSIAGTGGIANRLLSMGVVAIIITLALAGVIGMVARRWLKKRPNWNAANKYVGAGLGLVEGVFIAALLFWSLLMLEPIAQSQLAGPTPNPVAERVVKAATTARQSAFSGVANATNPLPEMDIVGLLNDFALITGHPAARDHLLQSEPIKRLQALPSLQAAIDEVKNDPALAGLVDDDGVSGEDVRTFLNSPTVLRIIDRGDAMRDITPLAADLKRAIREAKLMVPRPGQN